MRFQSTPLSEVCEVIMGQAPVGASYNENGEGLPLIAGAGDFGSVTPSPKKHTTAASKISQIGDLILCIRATIGDLNWGDKEYCLGRGVAGLRPKKSVLNKDYLWHFIQANKHQLSAKGTGSTFKQVSRSHIAEWEIPLPPLSEQKRIATILDKADAIRRKRQQAIQLADEFLRAVFLDMFGDPVTNPKGWEVETLSSLVVGKFQNGAYFPKEKYSSKGVEMVHMADAFYDVVRRGKLKRVNASAKEIKKYGLGVEDIMISRRSLNYEGAAKPTLIPESSEPLIFESSMIRLTPNPELINKRYLFQYLSDPSVKDHHVRKYVTGATIKGISQKNLEKVEVIVPPLDMQRKFEESANSVGRFVAKHSLNQSMDEDLFLSISQNFLC